MRQPLWGTDWNADQLGWKFRVIFPFVFNKIDSLNVLLTSGTALRLLNPKPQVVLSFCRSFIPNFLPPSNQRGWIATS